MINIRQVKRYCSEDITHIENYEKAISDDKQTWISHHRREIDEGLSVKQLKEFGLYYKRPANELIFLTRTEHKSLHTKGEKNPMYGKPAYNRGKHLSEEHCKTISVSIKGKNHPMYGRHLSEEHCKAISDAMKGKKRGPLSEETKQKLSELKKGEKNPAYCKPAYIRGKHRVWNDENDHSKGYHYEK